MSKASLFLGALFCVVLAGSAQAQPRTVADIFDLLARQTLSADTAQAQETLSRKAPSSDASVAVQSAYLIERAAAAARLGHLSAVIEARTKLVEISQTDHNLPKHLIDLSINEMTAGNWSRAHAHVRRVTSAPAAWWGQDIAAQSLAARMQTFFGDTSSARTQTDSIDALIRKGRSFVGSAGLTDLINAMLGWAKADTLLADGNVQAGERALKAAHAHALADTKLAASRSKTVERSPAEDVTWQLLDLIQMQLIRLHLRQGRLQEAELLGRQMIVRNADRYGRNSPSTALALATLGEVLVAQGRYQESTALADAAVDDMKALGVPASAGFSFYSRQVAIVSRIGILDWRGAVDRIDQLRESLTEDEFLLKSTERQPAWALALLRMGRARQAAAWLTALVAEQERFLGADRYETAESKGLLGVALAATGDTDRAFSYFAAALPALTARRRGTETEAEDALRRHVRRAIFEAYADLIYQTRTFQSAAMVEDSFRLGDAMLGGAVQSALAASAARALAGTPKLSDLIRGEQDARLEIAGLNDRLLALATAADSKEREEAVKVLRARVDALTGKRAELFRSIEEGFPDYANLISPRPAALDEARKSLASDEALLLIVPGASQTFVGAVRPAGAMAFHASSMSAQEVASVVAKLRQTLDPGSVTLPVLRQFDYAAAHRLYLELLAPVEQVWRDAKTLVVAADGVLGQLPLSLTLTQSFTVGTDADQGVQPLSGMKVAPWLARKVAVANVPSVNAFVRLRALPQGSATRTAFAGFGDPQFGRTPAATGGSRGLRNINVDRVAATRDPSRQAVDYVSYGSLSPLPETREEIEAIARVLGADFKQDVFFGALATRNTVKSIDLAQRRILAFATHGLVPGDLPGLTQPALAMTQTDDPKESPLLTLEDVLGLKLDADWVVLSACNTASGDGAGAEALSGLGRGFFYAGSRALLATHWPVESESARVLVTGIFERYAKNPDMTRAQALNDAMLALIDGPGSPEFSYAHPIFWAPYALFGDGRR